MRPTTVTVDVNKEFTVNVYVKIRGTRRMILKMFIINIAAFLTGWNFKTIIGRRRHE